MNCELCNEGTVKEASEYFEYTPRDIGKFIGLALMHGRECDTCGCYYTNSEDIKKTTAECKKIKEAYLNDIKPS